MEKVRLIEKYSPNSLEEMKLPKRIYTLVDSKRNTKGYRLLLYGTCGIGKSTTARIITKNDDRMYLSGSNNFNIELLRTKIEPFCSSFSINGKQKTLIVDECENMSNQVQDAFKMILDQSKNVNFIFITNEVEKLIDPFRSRCTNIEYNFKGEELEEQKKNYVTFLHHICVSEGLEFDKAGLSEIYKVNFPDFRHAIDNIQQLIDQNQSVTGEHVKFLVETGNENRELYEIIDGTAGFRDSKSFYQELSKFKGREKDCFNSLGEPFFRYLNNQQKYDEVLSAATIVANYSNQLANSLSKFTTFLACCSELRTIFR